ncbi:hypothetical protein NE237_001369 [Protea cynaroides]|uniref:Uncharacterized protein n=1 Tax=Protea cynaroides TaxID=273540 RepID=A0A9Q0KSY7_9MAGN|nr:hypothetical protein NE237_001369 [Protea cynaroides]
MKHSKETRGFSRDSFVCKFQSPLSSFVSFGIRLDDLTAFNDGLCNEADCVDGDLDLLAEPSLVSRLIPPLLPEMRRLLLATNRNTCLSFPSLSLSRVLISHYLLELSFEYKES